MKVVIIGSGLASISAAKVAISKGYKPLIIDPNNKAPNKSKSSNYFLAKNKKYFPIKFKKNKDIPPYSYFKGGLALGWGGTALPISNEDLKNWPIGLNDLEKYYKEILKEYDLLANNDLLEKSFNIYTKNNKTETVHLSYGIKKLLNEFSRKEEGFLKNNILFGQSRILIDKNNKEQNEPLSIDRTIDDLIKRNKIDYYAGYYLDFYQELDGKVILNLINEYGYKENISCDKVFIGAGSVSSTRIYLNSHKIFSKTVKLLSTENYFLPILSLRKHLPFNKNKFPGIFIDFIDKSISNNWIHCQVSTLNSKMFNAAGINIPKFKGFQSLFKLVESFFYVVQIGLNSNDSNYYEIKLEEKGELNFKFIEPKYTGKKRRKLSRKIFKLFLSNNLLVLTPLQFFGKNFKSYYVGGTLPLKKNPTKILETDILGRPTNLKNVHFIDSSVFPDLPSTTFAFTIMANSARITDNSL